MSGTPHERSAPDEVIVAALGQTARGGSPDCPDADELAAYYERSLNAGELARAETHVASCRACQERLVALVRSEPTPAPAQARWRVWPWSPRRWAWAAPALAAALVAAVWLATRPATVPVPEFTVASKLAVTDVTRQEGSEETSAVTAPVTTEKPKSTQAAGATPPVGGERAAPTREASTPEVAAATPPAGVVAGRVEVADERMAKADKPVAKEGPAATERRADTAATRAFASARAVLPVFLPTPGGRIIWRVDAAGTIARSNDGGTTWVVQVTAGVGLTAGSAVSDRVCWVVGRGGAVLRTDDGERWARVTPPADVDLIQIEAIDALHAQVTASDGRRFETSDGGQTWVVRQPA